MIIATSIHNSINIKYDGFFYKLYNKGYKMSMSIVLIIISFQIRISIKINNLRLTILKLFCCLTEN